MTETKIKQTRRNLDVSCVQEAYITEVIIVKSTIGNGVDTPVREHIEVFELNGNKIIGGERW